MALNQENQNVTFWPNLPTTNVSSCDSLIEPAPCFEALNWEKEEYQRMNHWRQVFINPGVQQETRPQGGRYGVRANYLFCLKQSNVWGLNSLQTGGDRFE